MKKRLIILISICVLSLFFVTLFACGKEMFNVKYIAEEGGIVYGEINQTVESGKNCTQVYAEAEEGYRFTGWSDGLKNSQRLDLNIKEDKTVTAHFEKIEYVYINYSASNGGIIYGELSQTVEVGGNCTQVYAVASEGYRFTGWSDGVESAQRVDRNVRESRDVSACFEKIEYVKLEYKSDIGGIIYGNIFQTVEKGKDGTQVYAEAHEGYRFTGWSDGTKSAQRLEQNVTENKTITAQFEKIEYVNVNYTAEEGGIVYGEINQTVESGQDCTQVYAEAHEGYRFTGWSDGIESAQRLDRNVSENKNIKAQFERIKVLFYSENLLVREYYLNDFKTLDLNKIVGYASFKIFDRWEFTGVYAGYNSETPLNIINTYFTSESNIPDITLRAVFSAMSETAIVPDASKTIAHGLGGIDGKKYLNSKEAFEYWYNKGERFFEVDISLTSDDKIVCGHFLDSRITYDEFKATKTENYTPLDLNEFLNLLMKYNDAMVDFDVLSVYYGHYKDVDDNFVVLFSEFDKILKNVDPTGNLYERLILEILPNNKTDMFNIAKNYCSFANYLYAEYYDSTAPINDDNIREISKWCQNNNVNFLSIESNVKAEWVSIMHEYDIYIMVFTINSAIDAYRFFDMGVDCIFTDFTFI